MQVQGISAVHASEKGQFGACIKRVSGTGVRLTAKPGTLSVSEST